MNWQPWDVEWSDSADRDLRRLSSRDQERIIEEIEQFAATGQGDVGQLKGRPGEWRARAGDVRAIFRRDQEGRRIIVEGVHRRDRAYR